MNIRAIIRSIARETAGTLPEQSLLDLRAILAAGFRSSGQSLLSAEELAERWEDEFSVVLENELARQFDSLGVPRPFKESSRPGMYVTFLHRAYAQHMTGLRCHVTTVLRNIYECGQKELLAVVAGVLVAAGCDPVLITDGPGDGGVDVAGRISSRPGHGQYICVQAKALTRVVMGRDIRQEYGVFRATRYPQGYTGLMEKMETMAGGKSRVGAPLSYIFCSRRGFDPGVEEVARELKIGLMHPLQIAHWLVTAYGPEAFRKVVAACKPIKRDLTRNVAHSLSKELLYNMAWPRF